MKVKIKDLKPNPYRDMENYPINREKVEALRASIKQTGFWDNILARPKPGYTELIDTFENGDPDIEHDILTGSDRHMYFGVKDNKEDYLEPIFELAYGHHRWVALKEVLSPEDTIDIPVKDLDDSTIIKIMANENMDEWKASPKVIDETVRVTKLFLQEHPEELKKYQKYNLSNPVTTGIALFLNWNETRVGYSLQRLGMIEEKKIEKEAIYDLPTDTSARTFSKVIKKHKIPITEQKKFAEKIKEKESYGESAMDDVWVQDKYTKPQKKEHKDYRILTLENKISQARNFLDEAADEITDMIRLIKELGTEPFNQSVQGALFMLTLNRIEKQISQLRNLNLNENENKSSTGKEDPKRIGK